MAVDEREDFISEMYALAVEEGFLHEAPRGVTDLLPTGDVVHGPWDPEACSKVLARWHAEAMVILYVLQPAQLPWQSRATELVVGSQTFYELSAEDSAALLSDPARWQVESGEGLVCIAVSDSANAVPYETWRGIAAAALGAE